MKTSNLAKRLIELDGLDADRTGRDLLQVHRRIRNYKFARKAMIVAAISCWAIGIGGLFSGLRYDGGLSDVQMTPRPIGKDGKAPLFHVGSAPSPEEDAKVVALLDVTSFVGLALGAILTALAMQGPLWPDRSKNSRRIEELERMREDLSEKS